MFPFRRGSIIFWTPSMNSGVIHLWRDAVFILQWSLNIKTNQLRLILFAAVALLHLVIIMTVTFQMKIALRESAPVIGTLRLINLEEILSQEPLPPPSPPPPPPPPPADPPSEVLTAVQEAVAQYMIEADEEPSPAVNVQPQSAPGGVTGGTPGRVPGETAGYVRQNFNYIQRLIRAKITYPPQARRAGIQGVTEVGFTIHEDGSISDVIVRSGSGHAILDNAALAAVSAAAPFPRPPAPARIAIPISFNLR
jgi:protein TonB